MIRFFFILSYLSCRYYICVIYAYFYHLHISRSVIYAYISFLFIEHLFTFLSFVSNVCIIYVFLCLCICDLSVYPASLCVCHHSVYLFVVIYIVQLLICV